MGTINIYSGNGANKAGLIYNGSGDITVDTEHLANTSSDVQAQIDTKAPINNAQFTGNVGIGTDAPVTALQVDPGYITLGTSSGTDNSWINNVEDGNLELVNEGRSTDSGAVRINRKNNPAGDTTHFRDTSIYDGKSNLIFHVDGSAGNVGIGTDNPLAALDVHGNVRLGTGGSVDIKMNTGGAGGITARQNSSDAGMLSMKITEPGSTRGWGFEFGDGVAEVLGNHYLRVDYPSGNTTLAGTLDVGGLLSFPSSGLVALGSSSKQTIALPNDGGITIGSGYTFANIYGTGGNLHLRANSYIANTGTPSQITLSTASAGGGSSPDVTIKEGFVSSKKGTIQTVLNQATLYTSINPVNTWAEASSYYRVSITPRYSSGTKILGTFSIPINPQGASNILMAMNPWYSTDGGTTKTLLNQGGPAGSRVSGSHAWFRSSNGYDYNDMQNHIIHFGHTPGTTTTLTFGFYFRSEGSNTTYFCHSGGNNGTWGWTAPVYMELREVETA